MSGLSMLLATASSKIIESANNACGTSCNKGPLTGVFQNVATTLIFIIGAVSVIMVIVGGLRYVLSNGDAKAVTDAKHTIMYAIIGVVVAISAYAIIAFVTTNVK